MNNNQGIFSKIYNSAQAKVYGAILAAGLAGCATSASRLEEQLSAPVASQTRYSLEDMRSFAQEYLRLDEKTDRSDDENARMDNLLSRMRHGLQTSEGNLYLLINYQRTENSDPVSYIVRSALTLNDIATSASAVSTALPSDKRFAELVARVQESFNAYSTAQLPQAWDNIGYLMLSDEGQVNAIANHSGALTSGLLRLVNESGEPTSAEVTEGHYAVLTDGDKTNGEIHAERPGAILLVIRGQQPVPEAQTSANSDPAPQDPPAPTDPAQQDPSQQGQ